MSARRRIGLVLLLLATPALAQAYRLPRLASPASLEDRVRALERDSGLQVYLADEAAERDPAPADPRTLEPRVRALEDAARLRVYPAAPSGPSFGGEEAGVARSLEERVRPLEERRRLRFHLASRAEP
jgi:hypothetical protein